MPAMAEEVQTTWLWYRCPGCDLKIAVTYVDLEKGLEPEKQCPRCKKPGWAKTNIQEATYSMGSRYGEKPK